MSSVQSSETSHPAMDMAAHRHTWEGFVKLVKWGSVSVVVLLILMAIFLVH